MPRIDFPPIKPAKRQNPRPVAASLWDYHTGCTRTLFFDFRKSRRQSRKSTNPYLYSTSVNTPGRIRTYDPRFRKPVLYPLSYGCTFGEDLLSRKPNRFISLSTIIGMGKELSSTFLNLQFPQKSPESRQNGIHPNGNFAPIQKTTAT